MRSMNRQRHEMNNVPISSEEYGSLEYKFDILRNEFSACKRKLESKCEAVLILSKELDQCRSERDQFKLMAEQLRDRYQSLKKQMSGQVGLSRTDTQTYKQYCGMQGENIAKLLYDSRELVKSQQFVIDDLKQKLNDAQGDIKLLREQIARQRVGTTDEGMNTRHFPAHEREDLVKQLEAFREQYLQLERDLQTVLDEKQEFVTERDAYKTKYDRLNQELNYILKGDENRIVDIDALVMENKYLQECLKQMEEEKTMAMAAVSKYKSLLESRKNKSCIKLGQSRGGGLVITQKEVHQVLESQGSLIPTPQAMADLQALAGALLDSVNDKNLALSHQRKTNKILGSRIAELEKKLKTLEVAGLWNVPATISASLEKIKSECEEVKIMVPARQNSETSELSASTEADQESDLGTVSPLDSALASPEESPTHGPISRTVGHQGLSHLELEDLDLLPTKEVSAEFDEHHMRKPNFKITSHDDLRVHPGHTYTLLTKDVTLAAEKILVTIPEPVKRAEQDFDADRSEKIDAQSVENEYEIHVPVLSKGISSVPKQREPEISREENEATFEDIHSTDTEESSINLTVYGDDKVTETDESDVYADLDDDFVGGSKAEIDTFYDSEQINLAEFEGSNNENEEQSQEMSLLMENATQKIKTISQCLSLSDDHSHIYVNDTTKEDSDSSMFPTHNSNSQKSPLLQDQEHYKPDPDEPHDIEC